MSKVCTVCKEEKPLDQFYKQPAKIDGHQSLCKTCHKKGGKESLKAYKSGEKAFQCFPVYPLKMDTKEWQVGKYAGHISFKKYANHKPYICSRITLEGRTSSRNYVYEEENRDFVIKEAEKWLWQKSLEYNLLKNRIRVRDAHTIEVELSKGQVMTTDIQFADLCQKYCIHTANKEDSKGEFYANILCENGRVRFHRHITGFTMVDHINRDPLDNRLSNLREATFKMNNNNVSMHRNNTSGFTGVRFADGRWIARLEFDGKNISKSFSIKKYGEEEAKRLAIEHRIALCKQYGNNNQLSKDIPNFVEQ